MPDKTSFRSVSGTITADPLQQLPLGVELHFSVERFAFDAPGGLNSINNWDFFKGAVIALHFGNASNQRIMGSGVMVAPGIAVTARHVVEPEMSLVMAGGGFICTGIAPSGLMIWRTRHVTTIPQTDLAILTLEYASALPDVFRHASITTRLPKIGEQVFLVGQRHEAGEPTTPLASINMKMMVAAGIVTARYEQGRDRVMLPGPALEVDCPALGGMSGGPAFDESGFLVGLLSSSLADGPAFLSLLWPALTTKVTPPWPPGVYKDPTSLLELDRKLCGIDRPDAIVVERDEITEGFRTVYRRVVKN